MKNNSCVFEVTEDMLHAANMSTEAGLRVTSLNKAVIITETDVLECVPDELCDLFNEFGINPATVRSVLAEDNGILEALTSAREQ